MSNQTTGRASVPAIPTVTEFDVILRQAEVIAAADIVPAAYRRQPANVVVAALTGRTFGWDVMTAMRNIHVIEGQATLKPEAMLGLVRRAGHSVTGTMSPTGATVTGTRRDTGDRLTVTWTVQDAERASLWGKRGPWTAYPAAMFWARVVSQLCRALFADVVLGLSHTPDELADALGVELPDAGEPARLPGKVTGAGAPDDFAGRLAAATGDADTCRVLWREAVAGGFLDDELARRLTRAATAGSVAFPEFASGPGVDPEPVVHADAVVEAEVVEENAPASGDPFSLNPFDWAAGDAAA